MEFGDSSLTPFSPATQDVEIVLGKNSGYSYSTTPIANPNPLQASIFKDWLRKDQ
jgi:hypothetical protein